MSPSESFVSSSSSFLWLGIDTEGGEESAAAAISDPMMAKGTHKVTAQGMPRYAMRMTPAGQEEMKTVEKARVAKRMCENIQICAIFRVGRGAACSFLVELAGSTCSRRESTRLVRRVVMEKSRRASVPSLAPSDSIRSS